MVTLAYMKRRTYGRTDVCTDVHDGALGSLSTRVFETQTATGREHFACQDSGVSQIFIRIISNGKKILSNVNVFVWRQVKRENSSLPVAVRVSKTRVLKLPIARVRLKFLAFLSRFLLVFGLNFDPSAFLLL